MAKIIRTVRISRPVVTLGQAAREIFGDAGEDQKGEAIDLAALLEARLEEVRERLGTEWETRLQEERERLQAEAARELEAAEARWRAEREQMHKERFEAGYQAGVAAREDEVREAMEHLGALHESFGQKRAQIIKEAEGAVVELALALARRVVGVQVEMDRKILLRVVRSALEHLSERGTLVLKVHPDDLQLARRFAGKWVEKVERDAVLKVEASERVGRGGCMVEGREENVDARLEKQFEVLQEALRAVLCGDEEKANGD